MKHSIKTFTIALITAFMAIACSTVEEEAIIEEGQTLFETSGYLDCEISESCQDVYEMNFKVGSQISILVSEINGNSVMALTIYSPGMPLGGMNLLTQSGKELSCGGQNEDESVPNFLITEDGVHKIAVTRN